MSPMICRYTPSATVIPPNSPSMESSISAVEAILDYNFKDKTLLEEALTHSSCSEAKSYQRLEFLGDSAIGLAVSNFIYLTNTELDPGQLSQVRAANISTEKFARVAVRHGLYQYMNRHNSTALDNKVWEFTEMVRQEDHIAAYGGSLKAPKVLANIVESVAAALYIDLKFDLEKLWVVIRGLLEPIITIDDLLYQPHPVTSLFEICQKEGKHVDIKHWKTDEKDIASVYVDGEFVASSSSKHKEISKVNAAKIALDKLSKSLPVRKKVIDISFLENGTSEIEGAKQKLQHICCKKNWKHPKYDLVKNESPSHQKKYMSSVKVPTPNGVLYMEGDMRSRVKDAENSAASLMLRSLIILKDGSCTSTQGSRETQNLQCLNKGVPKPGSSKWLVEAHSRPSGTA